MNQSGCDDYLSDDTKGPVFAIEGICVTNCKKNAHTADGAGAGNGGGGRDKDRHDQPPTEESR